MVVVRQKLSGCNTGGNRFSSSGTGTSLSGKKIKTITVTTSEPALLLQEDEVALLNQQNKRQLQVERRALEEETVSSFIPEPETQTANVVSGSNVATLITHATPIVLNECLLESKNIVVTKKDNNYILFTAAPETSSESAATTVTASGSLMLPVRRFNTTSGATLLATGGSLSTGTSNTVQFDTVQIEDLLKKDKIIKQTELHPDGTTATTYIFDECGNANKKLSLNHFPLFHEFFTPTEYCACGRWRYTYTENTANFHSTHLTHHVSQTCFLPFSITCY